MSLDTPLGGFQGALAVRLWRTAPPFEVVVRNLGDIVQLLDAQLLLQGGKAFVAYLVGPSWDRAGSAYDHPQA